MPATIVARPCQSVATFLELIKTNIHYYQFGAMKVILQCFQSSFDALTHRNHYELLFDKSAVALYQIQIFQWFDHRGCYAHNWSWSSTQLVEAQRHQHKLHHFVRNSSCRWWLLDMVMIVVLQHTSLVDYDSQRINCDECRPEVKLPNP